MAKRLSKTTGHGERYTQFYHKPKEAIKHLKRVKQGECIAALHRTDIGDIDIIWGENDPKTNKGYGLKHIMKKSEPHKRVYESKAFRFVIAIQTKSNGEKKWLLTAFDLRKKPKARTFDF